VDVKTGKVIMPNRIKFLPDAMGNGALGHGDRENNGFLRNKVQEGLSLIAVIVVTDEEDCSSQTTKHFTPMAFLNSNDPNYNVDLNLRCFKNKANLYPVERYVNGLKALRAGNEQLVVFAAITGVPPDLVDKAAYDKAGDWTKDSVRDQFYSQILADPRMQEKEDPTKTPGNGNLTPSCVTPTSSAAPPIRIVNVAKGFGANGLVKSICTVEQFGPAMDAIIEIIAKQLGAVCLPRPLVRQADGTVGCEVVWELPPAGMAQAGTPTDCGGARGYLLPVSEGSAVTNDRDGKNCRVAQLGVNTTTHAMMASKEGQTEGWFYDDFSDDLKKSCSVATPQRVAFTPSAKPPTGVTVKLECLNETQTVADNRNDALMPDHPTIGTQCSEDAMHNAIPVDQRDAKCAVSLSDGKVDTSLMCHPTANVCVRTCSSDNDCPPAWVCDNRAETLTATKNAGHPNGSPICVNPTCGNK
jgi:hypothetical protein